MSLAPSVSTWRAPWRSAAVVEVGGPCNDRCVTCDVAPEARAAARPADEVAEVIERLAAERAEAVVFAGGEPTLHPGLVGWLRLAKARGLATGVVTNGRLLSYPQLARAVARAGIGWARVKLGGADAETHQRVSRSDGFEQALLGVRHLLAARVPVELRVLVTSENLEGLDGLVTLVRELPGTSLSLALPEALEAGAEVATREATQRAMADLLGLAQRRGVAGRVSFVDLPPCWSPPGFDPSAQGAGPERYAPPCWDCSFRSRCPGVPAPVRAQLGDAAAEPLRGARSNSFNLAPAGSVPWPTGAPCPLLDAPPEPSPERVVHVAREGALRRFETRSHDFTAGELHEVVDRTGQLYVDVSDKPAPDDFAADLRKLVPLPVCGSCPRARACGRAWQVSEADVFGPDDAALSARISALRGDVLDVGCGHGPYGELLEPLARAGAIRYVGLEPEVDRVEELRARWPWATVLAGTAEEADLAPEGYDHILVLRSFNHLASPRAVLVSLIRALRPGGTLLIADNVVFGLAREAEAVARAEQGPAIFEHFRNDGAAEALAALASLPRSEDGPLELLARADVGPGTSNQWFLHLAKPSAAR